MSSPPNSLKNDSQVGILPAHKSLQAINTVAAGSSPRFIQLPSPVYVASWISTTHVLIAAGGGGSRFGMANVLVLLSIHLSNQDAVSPEMGDRAACSGLSMKLNAEQHKMIATAAPPSFCTSTTSTGAGVHIPHLWTFVAALDLGGDVPWCASKYLHLERSEVECGAADDSTNLSTREWALNGNKCLQCTHGIIALSSIRTFSLIAVEHVSGTSQTGESIKTSESLCCAAYRLRLLARIALPSETGNEDKKPIAMVRYAVVVAHDECGIYAYDLRSLLPQGERGNDAGEPVVQAIPMAQWTLPDRVNDLHADRFNWVLVRPFSKALALDYVLIVALVRDKTLRLGSFRQNRCLPIFYSSCRGQAQSDEIVWESEEEEPSKSKLSVIGTIKEEAVLTGVDCGLQFNLFPSSMRLVRLFGLETLSFSAQECALKTLALRVTEDSAKLLRPLPLVSLIMVVYDQHRNQSFFLHAYVMISGCPSAPFLAKETLPKSDEMLQGSDPNGKGGRDPLIHYQIRMGAGGPSPIVKDAITCFSQCSNMDEYLEFAPNQTQMDLKSVVGASFPTHWLAGTVEGWIVLVVRNPKIRPEDLIGDSFGADPSCTHGVVEGGGGKDISSEYGDTSPPFFVLRHARPSPLLSQGGKRRNVFCWGNPNVPLHSEPVTAVAVSKLNDILSTDLAQNVVLSTLPMPIRAVSIASLPNHLGSMELLPKVEDLELFPKELNLHAELLGGLATVLARSMRLRWILLVLTVLWGIFLLF
ncbi:unnamed protein product [Phytomonas sp. Hart1]|nr:unnamed protein product [Phytomonas sp. Hart1]|eukprot:CCW67357.1 unnamed protein product [Phytomonas sp. isolate Hart1]